MPPLTIRSVIDRAWPLTTGAKAPIWIVVLVTLSIAIIVNYIATLAFGLQPNQSHFYLDYIILPLITNILIAPFYTGSIMVAVRRARDEKVDPGTGFQYFTPYIYIVITVVIVGFISSCFVIFINHPSISAKIQDLKPIYTFLAGILSALIYAFLILSIPLVADKNYSPLTAIQKSIQLTSPVWYKIFLLILFGYLCIIISLIPCIIGLLLMNTYVIWLGIILTVIALVWVVPFLFLIHGVVYRMLVNYTSR